MVLNVELTCVSPEWTTNHLRHSHVHNIHPPNVSLDYPGCIRPLRNASRLKSRPGFPETSCASKMRRWRRGRWTVRNRRQYPPLSAR